MTELKIIVACYIAIFVIIALALCMPLLLSS